jgi:hypothetical protein
MGTKDASPFPLVLFFFSRAQARRGMLEPDGGGRLQLSMAAQEAGAGAALSLCRLLC